MCVYLGRQFKEASSVASIIIMSFVNQITYYLWFVVCVYLGRQFKEASRIASELKTIAGRDEEVKGQISDTETKLTELNKELAQHSEELEAIKNETDAQEKQEGMHVVLNLCI